jgi:hypothetical protein
MLRVLDRDRDDRRCDVIGGGVVAVVTVATSLSLPSSSMVNNRMKAREGHEDPNPCGPNLGAERARPATIPAQNF